MTEQDIADIKKAIEDKKVIVGKERTLKSFKTEILKTIYIAKNCPETVKQDISHYGKIAGIKIVQLEQPNDELGALCRKQFSVLVIGVKN